MDKDKELYNRYQNEIPDYETFKSIKNKKLKTLLFTGWIAKFGSKKIREVMNIPYATYDYNSRNFGPNSANNAEEDTDTDTKKESTKNKRTVIEIEGFTRPDPVIEEKGALAIINDAPSEPSPKVPEPAKVPFISVEWINTPETLKSQLEAIANVLMFEKGEIKVKLEVYK